MNQENKFLSCCQIARLEKDKEELIVSYQSSDSLRDGKRAEALLREKTQLLLRLKGLEAEVAELRAQKEDSGQQAENVQRIQIRQLSEYQATLKALEVRHSQTNTQTHTRPSDLFVCEWIKFSWNSNIERFV